MGWRDQLWGCLRWGFFKTWRYMHGLLHLNLCYRENTIPLWAKTQIWEISFLSQVNYFWWKASQCFATGMQLYTQNIMHVHTESALPGVSVLMPSSMPSSPAKLFMECKEKTQIQKWKKKQTQTQQPPKMSAQKSKLIRKKAASHSMSQLLPKQKAMGTYCYY